MNRLALFFGLASITFGSDAFAQSAGTPQSIFSCSLGKKIVSVSSIGEQIVYRFGTPSKVEMSIIGGPNTGNLFYMAQRYAGMEYQLRFTNGAYSYIVYTMEGNGRTGIDPISGLVVMRGKTWIADMKCVRHAEFRGSYDLSSLPEDTEDYSAM